MLSECLAQLYLQTYIAYFRREVPKDYHLGHCQRLPGCSKLAATQMSGCIQMLPAPSENRIFEKKEKTIIKFFVSH